eukprot:1251851-Lingulodinium_polyedra.AAC.1
MAHDEPVRLETGASGNADSGRRDGQTIIATPDVPVQNRRVARHGAGSMETTMGAAKTDSVGRQAACPADCPAC